MTPALRTLALFALPASFLHLAAEDTHRTAVPAATADKWLADAAGAFQAGMQQAGDLMALTPDTGTNTALWVGLVVLGQYLLPTALRIAATTTGLPFFMRAAAMIADHQFKQAAPETYRKLDEQAQVRAKGFKEMVDLVEELAETGDPDVAIAIKAFKKKFNDRMPDNIKREVNVLVGNIDIETAQV
jgi:hypothetical protein